MLLSTLFGVHAGIDVVVIYTNILPESCPPQMETVVLHTRHEDNIWGVIQQELSQLPATLSDGCGTHAALPSWTPSLYRNCQVAAARSGGLSRAAKVDGDEEAGLLEVVASLKSYRIPSKIYSQ